MNLVNTSVSVTEKLRCSHCGERASQPVYSDSNDLFCCQGCRMVFELLHEHDLDQYYSFDELPGQTIKAGLQRPQFDILEDPKVQQSLIEFTQGTQATTTFYIPSIHCTSCVWLLEHLQKIDDGIYDGRVNFIKRSLRVRFDQSRTSLRSIAELLSSIGYEPQLRLNDLDSTANPNSQTRTEAHSSLSSLQKTLWLKLGVAGFAFGNVMLFSFPEYLDLHQSSSDVWMSWVFGGLNILLSIPVLLFSASDYLKSAWAALAQGGINLDVPISIGIIALFGRSLYEILSGTGAGYFDSFTGFIFFLLIGKLIQKKTFDHLSFDRDYRSYLPLSVLRKDSTTLKESAVAVTQLEIGDRIRIRNEELIPVDAVLEDGQADIDYHFITGESEAVTVKRGENVYAGGKVLGKGVHVLVSKKVEHSYLTELWNHGAMQTNTSAKEVTHFADRISPFFTLSVLFIAILALGFWWFIEPSMAFTVFTAVLIVACPCALALSTPFTLSSAQNVLSLNGLYIRSSSLIESLAQTNAFVFDKTGTLTSTRKTGLIFRPSQAYTNQSDECNKALQSSSAHSLHPLSKKIHSSLAGIEGMEVDHFEERTGLGYSSLVNGATIAVGKRSFVKGYIDSEVAEASNTTEHETSTSKNVKQLETQVHVAFKGEYMGYFTFDHGLREGVGRVLKGLKQFGPLYLVSGDSNKDVATFSELADWQNMHFNQAPMDKLHFMEGLESEGKKACMIGDGLNDAGALKTAHFGIALSDDMSSFSPACDAIIEGEATEHLAVMRQFSQDAIRVILFSFALSLLYNLIGLGFAVTGELSPLVAAIIMPASSISVMIFTFFTTRFIARKRGLKVWG